jgi:hypothetical protein
MEQIRGLRRFIHFSFEGGRPMAFVGIVVTLLGFLVASMSPGLVAGTTGRLVMVLVGIAISLFGIMGILLPAFQKTAVWRR